MSLERLDNKIKAKNKLKVVINFLHFEIINLYGTVSQVNNGPNCLFFNDLVHP